MSPNKNYKIVVSDKVLLMNENHYFLNFSLSTPVGNSLHYSSAVFIHFFQSSYCLQDVRFYYFPVLCLCIVDSNDWLFLFPLSSSFQNHIFDLILHFEPETRNI